MQSDGFAPYPTPSRPSTDLPLLALAGIAILIVYLIIHNLSKLPSKVQTKLRQFLSLNASFTPLPKNANPRDYQQRFNLQTDDFEHSPHLQATDFASPVQGTLHINQAYRPKTNPGHKGIDIHALLNTPVYASKAGTVVLALDGCSNEGSRKERARCHRGAGNYIIIQHANDFTTVYMHLTKLKVQKGDRVAQSELIGWSGNSGNSSAPHLHFEIHDGKTAMDPTEYLGD